ncbi:MAG TPA: hypothetical protein DC046_15750 [Rhodospirillaceae bacterium]|nr:hypothetical protein [Rhodospirillaceae bacterium]
MKGTLLVTAAADTLRPRNHHRATGAVLLAGLWLKVFVVALGLAQPTRAADDGANQAEQDLLAALHVICTAGGVKVFGSSEDDGDSDSTPAVMDLLDCARCCCTPVHGMALAQDVGLVQGPALATVLPPARSLIVGQVSDNPGNPRAPPALVLV